MLAKVQIKSEHCIGLLKVRFQHLHGHWQVIRSNRDLDVILQMTMCAWILHNLLINNSILQDWMVNSMELEENQELEHHNERANLSDQILAYMQEMC